MGGILSPIFFKGGKMNKKLLLPIYFIISILIFSTEKGLPQNFYKVNREIYRSAQPTEYNMTELEKFGIKTILNLRMFHSDKNEAEKTNLKLYHLKMRAGKIIDKDIIASMKIINDSEKPILIHCMHGSDRTGVVVAMYRIIFEGYTKEDAIKELKEKKYGYHEKIYGNIIKYIENSDIEMLKKEIFKK